MRRTLDHESRTPLESGFRVVVGGDIRREREVREEATRARLRTARSKRGEIGGRVRDRFRSDIFATDGNSWSDAAADPMTALNTDIREHATSTVHGRS